MKIQHNIKRGVLALTILSSGVSLEAIAQSNTGIPLYIITFDNASEGVAPEEYLPGNGEVAFTRPMRLSPDTARGELGETPQIAVGRKGHGKALDLNPANSHLNGTAGYLASLPPDDPRIAQHASDRLSAGRWRADHGGILYDSLLSSYSGRGGRWFGHPVGIRWSYGQFSACGN